MADPRKNKIATTHQEHLKQQRAKASEIKSKPNFATPGTEFKDTSGTNNQPERVTTGDRAKEGLKKAVKTSLGISPFTIKKEKLYAGDVGQSKGGIGTIENNISKQRRDNAQELEGNKGTNIQPKNTNYTSMLPEFEVTTPSKMYESPAKIDTVDPTTGQVLPTGMGQGPTNVGNANTAQTLQKQADAEAVKQNRAGTPDRSAGAVSQSPMTMKDNFKNNSMAHAARMFGNVSNPVPSPSQFNEGLRKASAQGKLDGNPSFKSKVDAAPIKAKGNPGEGTTLDTFEVNFEKEKGERAGKGKTDGQTTNSRIKKDGTKQSVDTYKGKKAKGTIQASF